VSVGVEGYENIGRIFEKHSNVPERVKLGISNWWGVHMQKEKWKMIENDLTQK